MARNQFLVAGLVFNETGQILMIKHKKKRKWLPPGGHAKENELPCVAVAREVLEETGVSVQVLSSIPELSLSGGAVKELPLPLRIMYWGIDNGTGLRNCINLLYLCRALNTNTTPQESEVDGIGWFSPEEAIKMDTYEDIIKTIESVIGHIQR